MWWYSSDCMDHTVVCIIFLFYYWFLQTNRYLMGMWLQEQWHDSRSLGRKVLIILVIRLLVLVLKSLRRSRSSSFTCLVSSAPCLLEVLLSVVWGSSFIAGGILSGEYFDDTPSSVGVSSGFAELVPSLPGWNCLVIHGRSLPLYYLGSSWWS